MAAPQRSARGAAAAAGPIGPLAEAASERTARRLPDLKGGWPPAGRPGTAGQCRVAAACQPLQADRFRAPLLSGAFARVGEQPPVAGVVGLDTRGALGKRACGDELRLQRAGRGHQACRTCQCRHEARSLPEHCPERLDRLRVLPCCVLPRCVLRAAPRRRRRSPVRPRAAGPALRRRGRAPGRLPRPAARGCRAGCGRGRPGRARHRAGARARHRPRFGHWPPPRRCRAGRSRRGPARCARARRRQPRRRGPSGLRPPAQGSAATGRCRRRAGCPALRPRRQARPPGRQLHESRAGCGRPRLGQGGAFARLRAAQPDPVPGRPRRVSA